MLTFEELLRPISRAEFLKNYWDQQSLHIPGEATKLARLPGLEEFGSFFAGKLSKDRWQPSIMSSHVHATWTDSTGRPRRIVAPPSQVPDLFNEGMSLCFQPLDAASPALSAFVANVLGETGFAGEVVTTAYLTPPLSGSDMHFDCQHVFFCQVSGEKHWKISKAPGFKWPPTNLLATQLEDDAAIEGLQALGWDVTPPKASEFETLTLKQGDILYMPPGVWHEPHTTDAHSFHYTLTLTGISSWSVLFPLLRKVMMAHPEWRRDLRFLGEPNAKESEEKVVERMLNDLRAALANVEAKELLGFYRATDQMIPGVRALFRV